MGRCLFMRKGETHSAPISGILASDLAVGSTVKLLENGSPVEYLVVNQGIPSNSSLYDSSCGGTWLLRKDASAKMQWDSTNNDYKNSDVHAYLNNDFLGVFDTDTKTAIKQVKIPYVNGTGTSGYVASGENGLSAKVFLLGGSEVGMNGTYIPVDGSFLDYFKDASAIQSIGWLRSPSTKYDTNVWYGISTTDMGISNEYSVRPALILPFKAVFDKDTLLLKGVA